MFLLLVACGLLPPGGNCLASAFLPARGQVALTAERLASTRRGIP